MAAGPKNIPNIKTLQINGLADLVCPLLDSGCPVLFYIFRYV